MSSTDSEPLRWPAKQPRAGAREADAAGGAPAAADVIGAPLLAGAGGPPAPAASAQGDEVAAAARPAGEAQETEEPPPGQAPKGVGRSRQRKSKVTCQVAGCGADLAGSKRHYKRYRICLYHSTLPSIVLDGREQRFCQQCGRFHDMSEFAGKRKSCQRKLDRHNQRRKEREAAGCDGPTGMARSPPADAEGESDAAADFGDPESDPGETSTRRRWQQQQQQQEAGGRQQPASAPRQRQQPLLAMSSEELAMLDEFVLGHLDLGSSMEAPLSPAQQPGSLQIAGLTLIGAGVRPQLGGWPQAPPLPHALQLVQGQPPEQQPAGGAGAPALQQVPGVPLLAVPLGAPPSWQHAVLGPPLLQDARMLPLGLSMELLPAQLLQPGEWQPALVAPPLPPPQHQHLIQQQQRQQSPGLLLGPSSSSPSSSSSGSLTRRRHHDSRQGS